MNQAQLLATTMIMCHCKVTDIDMDTGWSCITLKCDPDETKDFVEIDVWTDGHPSLQEATKNNVASIRGLFRYNAIAKLIHDDWERIKPHDSESMK